jgi:GT2 family glycosyltransferase
MAPPARAPTIIIVAWNSGAHLQRALDALAAQTLQDFDIILWDNASTDGAASNARLPPRGRLVRSEENLGFAGGNNRAAALAKGRYIVLLNPDAFPEPDWLAELLAAAERMDATCAASLQLMDADPALLDGAGDVMSICGMAWRGGYGQARARLDLPEGEVFSACAAAALYDRETFLRLGGFDERFFCYFEDVDLGFRLRLAGEKIVLAPRAVVRHIGSASTGKTSDFAVYHGTRNRLFTFAKCMPALLWPLALPAFALVQAYVLVRARSLGVWSPTWRGVRDGLRDVRRFLKDRPARGLPLARTWTIARALSWSPLALSRRAPVIRAR